MPLFGMHSARQVVPVVAHDIALRGHLEGRRIWEARNKALLSLPVVTMGEYLLNNPVFGADHVGHL